MPLAVVDVQAVVQLVRPEINIAVPLVAPELIVELIPEVPFTSV